MHLGDHIRRFGPAILFATESFESFNSVIRAKSVHSNRQAPSRDIAFAFAHANRVRSLVCGGRIRVRQSTVQDTQDTTHDSSVSWRQVAASPLLLLQESHTLRAAFSGGSTVNSTLCGCNLILTRSLECSRLAKDLAEKDVVEPRVASLTQTGKSFPAGFTGGADTSRRYATYMSFKLANSDTCLVGSWVLVTGSNRDSVIICRVEEIISTIPVDERAPETAEAVLLRCGTPGDHVEPYFMPSITTEGEQMLLLAPAVRLNSFNIYNPRAHANPYRTSFVLSMSNTTAMRISAQHLIQSVSDRNVNLRRHAGQ